MFLGLSRINIPDRRQRESNGWTLPTSSSLEGPVTKPSVPQLGGVQTSMGETYIDEVMTPKPDG